MQHRTIINFVFFLIHFRVTNWLQYLFLVSWLYKFSSGTKQPGCMYASSEIYAKLSAGPRMLSSQRRGASRLRYRYTSIASFDAVPNAYLIISSLLYQHARIRIYIYIYIFGCVYAHMKVPWRMYQQAKHHMSFPYSLIRFQRIGAEGFSRPRVAKAVRTFIAAAARPFVRYQAVPTEKNWSHMIFVNNRICFWATISIRREFLLLFFSLLTWLSFEWIRVQKYKSDESLNIFKCKTKKNCDYLLKKYIWVYTITSE